MRTEGVAPNAVPDRLEVVPGGLLEATSWEAVYHEHVGSVYRFALSRVGNRMDAEDVTATVFERALPRLREGAAAPQLRAYLLNTARTVIADHWRERHGVTLPEDIEEPSRADDGDGDGSDADVERILTALPANYRQVLELRFLRGYTLKETAVAMGTSVGNVKVMQLRALRRAAQEFLT
jgi:RNA polymerase sigma-70 factor, ECF subfamily